MRHALAACCFGALALTAANEARGQAPDVREALSAVTKAEAVQLIDQWIGLSPASPQRAEYHLRRDGKSLAGVGRFWVGPESSQLEDSAIVTIPIDQARKFLAELSSVSPRPGIYEPKLTHTDDYPLLSISLATPAGTIRLYSSSQGPGHVPWAMEYGGKTFVIDSSAPDQALDRLRPFLKLEKLRRLAREADGR